jgi:hypothetical protein
MPKSSTHDSCPQQWSAPTSAVHTQVQCQGDCPDAKSIACCRNSGKHCSCNCYCKMVQDVPAHPVGGGSQRGSWCIPHMFQMHQPLTSCLHCGTRNRMYCSSSCQKEAGTLDSLGAASSMRHTVLRSSWQAACSAVMSDLSCWCEVTRYLAVQTQPMLFARLQQQHSIQSPRLPEPGLLHCAFMKSPWCGVAQSAMFASRHCL